MLRLCGGEKVNCQIVCCRKALADSHAELTDDIQGVPLRDVATLQEYLEEVRIADAIYEADVARWAPGEPMLSRRD